MDNLKLLEYSIKHPEPLMDKNYMFLNKHVDLQKYVKKTQNIKNILIAIKEMKSANISGKTIDKMYLKLDKELNNYSVFSEFSCFINACDLNNGEVRGKIDLLKKVTDYYLKHRDLNDIVPAEWIQALIDKTTSRKKGQAGEKKLLQLLKTKRYNFVDTLEDFMSHNKSCARFSKKGGLSNKNLKREVEIDTKLSLTKKEFEEAIKQEPTIGLVINVSQLPWSLTVEEISENITLNNDLKINQEITNIMQEVQKKEMKNCDHCSEEDCECEKSCDENCQCEHEH